MSADPVEHAVNSLPPYMQRRMAKLSLAGARFIQNADGIYAWKVEDRNGHVGGRYMHLAQAIDDLWITWLQHKPRTEADTECFYDGMAREGFELP